jgi:Protein of unknown function (DUF2975)
MAEDRQKPYIGQGALDLFRVLLGLAGLALSIFAVLYAINGMTQAGGPVMVPVALQESALTWSGEAPVVVPGLPELARVFAPADALSLASWGSTQLEQLLARGGTLLIGLGLGAAALLLMPVLSSISRGEPFAAGNARRLGLLAVVVLVVGYVAPLLPQAATLLVLDRLGIGPDGPFVWSLTFSFLPLVLAALILATAEAFRRGESISADVEGLV